MVEYSYSVVFDPDGVNEDVSLDVEVLEVTEVGSGQVTSAVIRLNALFGKYLTNVPWTTPIPDQFHRFLVTITDEDGAMLERVYEIDTIVPIQNSQEGDVVEFECLGLEHHLMKIQFAKQFRFQNAFDVAEDICNFYNANRVQAVTQPIIAKHTSPSTKSGTGFNDLPRWNSNFYPFNNRATTCYDAISALIDSGGAPIPSGGLGDFFDFWFTKGATNNTIDFHAFSSGDKGTAVTIDNALDVNVAENEGGIEAFTGNLVKVEGSENGSLPPEYSDFVGKQEIYFQMPNWINPTTSNQSYPLGAIVLHNDLIYQSDITNNDSEPGTNWTPLSLEDFIGTGENYSIWTKGLSNETFNSGSNPWPLTHGAIADFNQSGMWDSNINVHDEVNWQNQAQERIISTADIDVNYLYGAVEAGTYRGQWFLVDSNKGTVGLPFTQNGGLDRFGHGYADAFVRRNHFDFSGAEDYKNWDVVGPLDSKGIARPSVNGDLAAILDEGVMYKKKAGVWTHLESLDVNTEQPRLNHCFHTFQALTTSAGFNDIPKISGNYQDSSAIKISYRYDSALFETPVTLFYTDPEFYRAGAWWCMRFPFPYSARNGASFASLYGNNATKKDPVTIDSKNMHLSRSGNVGYNQSEAEDYGPINSVNFFIKHEWLMNFVQGVARTNPTDKLIPAGDFKYRCTLTDTSGNNVVADFTIPFNDTWAPITLSINEFEAYRARTNLSLGNIRSTLIPLGIEVLNRFNWENISMISVQWQESYDDLGRFQPELTRVQSTPFAYELFVQGEEFLNNSLIVDADYTQVNLYIDGFHFGKTMLSVSPPITTGRAIEPPVEHLEWIDNKYQLDQYRDAMLQIHQFRQNKWNVSTEGRLDINFGDFFFLEDDRIVNRADRGATPPDSNDGDANTVKLVAKRIVHRIDKPATGVGGFITRIDGAKRYEGTPDN